MSISPPPGVIVSGGQVHGGINIAGDHASITTTTTLSGASVEALAPLLAALQDTVLALARDDRQQARLSEELAALRAAITAEKPNESGFMIAAKGIASTLEAIGAAASGLSPVLSSLRALAAACGWTASFLK